MLSEKSGYSIGHLVRLFHQLFFKKPPLIPGKPDTFSETFLLVDGLWLKKWYVMMVYRKSKDLTILHISIAGKEARSRIEDDLHHLLALGYLFTGIVSDGGRGVVGAIKAVFPHTLHQICMAHMHREATNALGIYPKDIRVKNLKRLADHIWLIESEEALVWWKKKRDHWIQTNWQYLMETRKDDRGKWWYIHKGPRKTVRILRKLPSTSFAFLTEPLMPKTTNEIEATFGHLGKRWLAHRGLKTERWENFMRWFVYFYNLKQMAGRKKKED